MDRTHHILGAALVLVLVSISFLLNVNVSLLSQSHEARVIETAREMRDSGDFVIPRFEGEPRMKKPPLAYYVATLSFGAASSPSLGAARVSVGILGVLTILCIYLIGRQRSGAAIGTCAALVASGSWLLVDEFRKVTPDPLLAFGLAVHALGVCGFGEQASRRHRHLEWILRVFGLAFALLAKGPIALFFATLPTIWLRRREGRVRWRSWLVESLVASIPLVLWASLVIQRIDGGLDVWWSELSKRVPGRGGDDGEGRSVTVYVGTLVHWMGVTTPVFLAALFARTPAAGGYRRWFLAGALCLAAIPSRKDAYWMPLVVPASLMVATVLVQGGPSLRAPIEFIRRLTLHVLPIAASVLAGMLLSRHYDLFWYEGVVVALLLLLIAASLLGFRRCENEWFLPLAAGVLGLSAYASIERVHHPQDHSRYHLGRFISERVANEAPLVRFEVFEPVVAFYARRAAPLVSGKVDLERFLESTPRPAYVLMKRSSLPLINPAPYRELATTSPGFRQGSERKVLKSEDVLVLVLIE